MSTIIRPMTASDFTIDVSDVVLAFVFAEDERGRFNHVPVKGCGLSVKLPNLVIVILRQHRRNNVPLGRERKDSKEITGCVEVVAIHIYIRKATAIARLKRKLLKCQTLGEIEFLLRVRIGIIAIVGTFADVHTVSRQRYIKSFSSGTHGKKVAPISTE